MQFLQFSRSDEAEADYFGLQYIYEAGYDPTAIVSFFEKLQAKKARSLAASRNVQHASADRRPDRSRRKISS